MTRTEPKLTAVLIEKIRETLVSCAPNQDDEAILNCLCDMALSGLDADERKRLFDAACRWEAKANEFREAHSRQLDRAERAESSLAASAKELEAARKLDIALHEAAHDLLVACEMDEHNDAIMHGKKGKAWSGEFVRKMRSQAMADVRALVSPAALKEHP
jgi:hypothetical protein